MVLESSTVEEPPQRVKDSGDVETATNIDEADILIVDGRIMDFVQNLQDLEAKVELPKERQLGQSILTQEELDANVGLVKHMIEIVAKRELDDAIIEEIEEMVDFVVERDRIIAWRNWRMFGYHGMQDIVFEME